MQSKASQAHVGKYLDFCEANAIAWNKNDNGRFADFVVCNTPQDNYIVLHIDHAARALEQGFIRRICLN